MSAWLLGNPIFFLFILGNLIFSAFIFGFKCRLALLFEIFNWCIKKFCLRVHQTNFKKTLQSRSLIWQSSIQSSLQLSTHPYSVSTLTHVSPSFSSCPWTSPALSPSILNLPHATHTSSLPINTGERSHCPALWPLSPAVGAHGTRGCWLQYYFVTSLCRAALWWMGPGAQLCPTLLQPAVGWREGALIMMLYVTGVNQRWADGGRGRQKRPWLWMRCCWLMWWDLICALLITAEISSSMIYKHMAGK